MAQSLKIAMCLTTPHFKTNTPMGAQMGTSTFSIVKHRKNQQFDQTKILCQIHQVDVEIFHGISENFGPDLGGFSTDVTVD